MRKLIFFLLFPMALFGQYKSSYREGVYKTLEELKNNTPFLTPDMKVLENTFLVNTEEYEKSYDIILNGMMVKKKFLRDSIFCVVKDSSIYFNGQKFYKKSEWTKKILFVTKNYLGFVPFFTYDDRKKRRVTGIGIGFSGAPLVVIPVSGNKNSSKDNSLSISKTIALYLIDLNTGKFISATEDFMTELLGKADEDLLLEYKTKINRNNPMDVCKILEKYEKRHE